MPVMKMVISNNKVGNVYRPNPTTNINSVPNRVPTNRLAFGGNMLGKFRFPQGTGCSSCGK